MLSLGPIKKFSNSSKPPDRNVKLRCGKSSGDLCVCDSDLTAADAHCAGNVITGISRVVRPARSSLKSLFHQLPLLARWCKPSFLCKVHLRTTRSCRGPAGPRSIWTRLCTCLYGEAVASFGQPDCTSEHQSEVLMFYLRVVQW